MSNMLNAYKLGAEVMDLLSREVRSDYTSVTTENGYVKILHGDLVVFIGPSNADGTNASIRLRAYDLTDAFEFLKDWELTEPVLKTIRNFLHDYRVEHYMRDSVAYPNPTDS